MELHCGSKITSSNTQHNKTSNVNAEKVRPNRSAAAVVEQKIREITKNENQ